MTAERCSCPESVELREQVAGLALLAYLNEEISIGRLAELLGCSIEAAQERSSRFESTYTAIGIRGLLVTAAAELDRRDEAMAKSRAAVTDLLAERDALQADVRRLQDHGAHVADVARARELQAENAALRQDLTDARAQLEGAMEEAVDSVADLVVARDEARAERDKLTAELAAAREALETMRGLVERLATHHESGIEIIHREVCGGMCGSSDVNDPSGCEDDCGDEMELVREARAALASTARTP